MSKILDSLFLPQMSDCGFLLNKTSGKTSAYYSFVPCDDIGEGFYNIVIVDDMFSVTIKKFSFYEDTAISWEQPEYLHIDYECNSEKGMHSYWGKGEVYRFVLPSNHLVASLGISLMPDYCSAILRQFDNVSEKEFMQALTMLDSAVPFFAGKEIMNQLKITAMSGRTTAVYYDAKIKEMLALLVEWYDDR